MTLATSLFFYGMVFILLLATFRKTDFFPFSRYPMFSKNYSIEKIRIMRISFQDKNGDVYPWQSNFYRYPEYIGKSLRKSYDLFGKIPEKEAFWFLDLKRTLLNVIKLLEFEKMSTKDIQYIRIEEVTVKQKNVISVLLVALIPISEITHDESN